MKRKAFTLIELLVVVSIIALLVSILMPALGRARLQARRVQGSTQIKQVCTGAIVWASSADDDRLPQAGIHGYWPGWAQPMDNDDSLMMEVEEYFKIGAGLDASVKGSFDHEGMTEAQIEAYYETLHVGQLRDLFVCPEQDKYDRSRIASGYNDQNTPNYVDRPLFMPFIHNYGPGTRYVVRLGYAYWAGFETEEWDDLWWPPPGERYRTPAKLSDPGHLVLMTDRVWYNASDGYIQFQHGPNGAAVEYFDPSEDPAELFPNVGTNVGYADGSVTFYNLSQVKPRIYGSNANANRVFNYF